MNNQCQLPQLFPHATLVSEKDVNLFPVAVIEVPRASYHDQSKTAMRVASLNQGGPKYPGPLRLYYPRWKHISTFYVIEFSRENYYLSQSLTNHPHYSILRSEIDDFEKALSAFHRKHRNCTIIRVTPNANYKDDFLIVINKPAAFPSFHDSLNEIDDSQLLCELRSQGKLDTIRGNVKIDLGFACGQNLERDLDDFGVTRPRLLDRTKEPLFLAVQKQLSTLLDLVCDSHGKERYHRVGNIHEKFAQTLQEDVIIPSWRVAITGPNDYLEVHEDGHNDKRPLMSPVGVLSRLYLTNDGALVRMTKIGYSRQSLYDAVRREAEIKPVVKLYKEWELAQPDIIRTVSKDLFFLQPNSTLPGVIEIPSHLERSVGMSPYIYAIIHLQQLLTLSRHQSVAILYNCVTNESPYYFYSVFEEILSMDKSLKDSLSHKSPTELGLWYHSMIWQRIKERQSACKDTVLPRRHQPHNGSKTTDLKISMSIVNLILLTDQLCFLDGDESKKQFYHSKAVAILMKSPEGGGCHACGGLTSQTLLYTLSCVGLVPICVSTWGELANTETAAFLEDAYNLSYSEGRSDQFLSCCVACSPEHNHEQVENRICKWVRWSKKKGSTSNTTGVTNLDGTKSQFRDGIWPGQSIYQPVSGKLKVVTRKGSTTINPPATNWPHPRGKRPLLDGSYWDQSTRSTKKKVLGGNRRTKRCRLGSSKTLSVSQVTNIMPDPLEILFQAYCKPLYLSINNLLGSVLGETNAVPNRRIVATRKKGGVFQFQLHTTSGEIISATDPKKYTYATQCKVNGALLLAMRQNPEEMSRYLSRLIASKEGNTQIKSRESHYYLIHNNNGRTKSKRSVVGIVRPIAHNRFVFVLMDDDYRTESMEFYFFNSTI
jgi:hypothetical protein